MSQTTEPRPPLYVPGTCPVCGATTYDEAETRCKVTRDITDEYQCMGGAVDEYELGRTLTGGPLHFHNPDLGPWMDRQLDARRASHPEEFA